MRVTYYRQGELFGWYNDFEKAGQNISEHTHGREMEHNIIVLRGSVSVNGVEYLTGAVLTAPFNWAHEVVALEDSTRTLHLLLHGDAGIDYPHNHTEKEGPGTAPEWPSPMPETRVPSRSAPRSTDPATGEYSWPLPPL